MEVESGVVLPRDIMESAARANPSTIDQLALLMQSTPWRLQNFGAQIVGALHPGDKG
jgi:hypothetical protein